MDNVFSCTCGCGLLRFESDEDGFISLMYYPYANIKVGFWDRLKIAWGILRGNPNYLFDMVVKREDFFRVVADIALEDVGLGEVEVQIEGSSDDVIVYCCGDFEDLHDFGFIGRAGRTWVASFYDPGTELIAPFDIYHCPFCGEKLESEEK